MVPLQLRKCILQPRWRSQSATRSGWARRQECLRHLRRSRVREQARGGKNREAGSRRQEEGNPHEPPGRQRHAVNWPRRTQKTRFVTIRNCVSVAAMRVTGRFNRGVTIRKIRRQEDVVEAAPRVGRELHIRTSGTGNMSTLLFYHPRQMCRGDCVVRKRERVRAGSEIGGGAPLLASLS